MATSGSSNFTIDRDDIITEALQIIGVLGEGESPNASQLTDCSRSLNMLMKSWQNIGLTLWTNEEVALFPVKGQAQYTLGSSGDRACLSSELITTQLTQAYAAAATTLNVDSTTGMAASDIVGIVTDSNGIHWTTIVSVDDATTITITDGLVDAASDNDRVYTYTTAFTDRPVRLLNAWVRQNDGTDIPIDIFSKQEYIDLSDKTTAGRINQLYADYNRDVTLVNVWPVPNDSYTNEYVRIYIQRKIEDFDTATDDADCPQEWYLALCYNLAIILCPKYGIERNMRQDIGALAAQIRQDAMDASIEFESIYLMPDNTEGSNRR